VNVVDDLDKSSFIVPSIGDRSPLVVAVSSSGASPMLARRIRARIEALLPAGLGRLAQVARAWRQSLRARVKQAGERRRFWDWFYDSAAARAALDAADEVATLDFDATLAAFRTARQPERGVVYLVGAGPGDPDLVTLKALEALGRADVILYDRLVSPDILARGRRDAERIYVGKQGFGPQVAQADTSALLARLAREGKTVVRLKGGDPFVFGRGGEEVLELVRQGITVHVIPGITAALGCAAAARIPLTHRGAARSVTFATAQLGDGDVAAFPGADSPEQTWVVYMGGRQLAALASRFVQSGLDTATPAAVISDGARPTQQIVYGSLATIAERARDLPADAAALLIVGSAVAVGAEIAATASAQAARRVSADNAASAA